MAVSFMNLYIYIHIYIHTLTKCLFRSENDKDPDGGIIQKVGHAMFTCPDRIAVAAFKQNCLEVHMFRWESCTFESSSNGCIHLFTSLHILVHQSTQHA
jgi:hypothetical protein